MASSINVKIAPLPRGDYSSSATYAKLDVVSYNGSSYMAIKAVPTGTVPTNTTYWQLLAEKPTIGDGTITTNMLADGAVTADKLDSSIFDKYAEVSGTYEDMVVGSAEQLLSTQYDTDSVPYAFRKSPYGDREFDEIVGGSIAWNQLVREIADTYYARLNCSASYSSGVATVTNSGTGAYGLYLKSTYRFSIIGHKYFVSATIKSDTDINNVGKFGFDGLNCPITASANVETTISTIQSATVANNAFVVYLQGNSATIKNAMCIDLTQMFGSSVADAIYAMEQSSSGSGVAFFRGLFPKSYYAYNAGQLISVSGLSAHKMTGENHLTFDWSKWGQCAINATPVYSVNTQRFAPYAYVIPYENNTQYTVDLIDRTGNGTTFYVGVGQYNGQSRIVDSGWQTVPYTFTVNPNTTEIMLAFRDSVNSDTAQYLAQLGTGLFPLMYETSHSYALDSSLTLRGVPKLVDNKMQFDGDIYKSDGSVERRYGIVDLGTLTFSASTNFFYRANSQDLGIIADVQAPIIAVDTNIDYVYYYSSSHQLRVYVKDVTKPLTGSLVYLLATPITESAEPYVNPQICNEYGTEEYISAEQSGVTMIVGHNTKYPQNLRKKIEGLPWNFSSLIAPTEVTNKATRNYTVGSFLIMNNTLYKVTSAIANGGTITVGSNVSATTIMQEILAL